MDKKKSEFDKVFSAWDILVIAFGAMIGWGWVVSSGDWIQRGGVLGAMIGFALGGVMIFFVGLTYAELTAAMPQCGGEHVFSYKAMGPIGSFICTWAIVLGYVSVVCFEACALPTIITYIYPGFLKGYLYTVAGFDIYASWLAVAILVAIFMTIINILGAKTAAVLQTVLTVIIGGVGLLLIASSVVTGDVANLEPQLFVGDSASTVIKSVFSVAVVTPFFFIGFDVIPQAAEEINVPLKKIGKIMILSIVLAVVFYALIIFGVGYVMSPADIESSLSGSGLVTADAMAKAFNSSVMSKVLIVGGMCGIITSWNSFLIGGSRAMYSMAESYMIPRPFSKLHKKHKTPVNALLLIGGLSVAAPFLGRKMLVWIVDAGNFGCCLAYCMVAASFIILRTKAPEMARPYKVKHYKIVGAIAVLMSGFMVVMYMIPGSGSTLVVQEWAMVGGWSILGVVFCIGCKLKYKEKFASHIDVEVEELNTEPDAVTTTLEKALETVRSEKVEKEETPAIDFSYFLPVNIVFGSGKVKKAGELTKPYGKKALIVTGRSSAKKSGIYDKVKDSLEAAGLTTVLYDKVSQNPLTTTAEEGAAFAKENYPESKSDFFAIFIEKCLALTNVSGFNSMITQQAWMTISSYEKLRVHILKNDIVTLLQLGPHAFDEIGGEIVQTASFIIRKTNFEEYKEKFKELTPYKSEKEKEVNFFGYPIRLSLAQVKTYLRYLQSLCKNGESPLEIKLLSGRLTMDYQYEMTQCIFLSDSNSYLISKTENRKNNLALFSVTIFHQIRRILC